VTVNAASTGAAGGVEFTMSDIASALGTQLGIPTGSVSALELRIRAIRVWEVTGNPIRLVPAKWELGTGNVDQYQELQDVAGRNHWSAIGFKWPSADSDCPISSSQGDVVIFTLIGAGSFNIHLELLWRFSNSRPSFQRGELVPV